jgi:hypothetical protein
MVSVEMNITQKQCDYCHQIASYTCQACGADLCPKCCGNITLSAPRICWQVFQELNWDILDHDWTEHWGKYPTQEDEKDLLLLCPAHFQELHSVLSEKVSGFVQKKYIGDLSR